MGESTKVDFKQTGYVGIKLEESTKDEFKQTCQLYGHTSQKRVQRMNLNKLAVWAQKFGESTKVVYKQTGYIGIIGRREYYCCF